MLNFDFKIAVETSSMYMMLSEECVTTGFLPFQKSLPISVIYFEAFLIFGNILIRTYENC